MYKIPRFTTYPDWRQVMAVSLKITNSLVIHYPDSNVRLAMLVLAVSLIVDLNQCESIVQFIDKVGCYIPLWHLTMLLHRVARGEYAFGVFRDFQERLFRINR